MWIDEEFDQDCDHLHLVLNGLLLSVVTVIWIYLIRVDSGFTPTVWGLTEKHVNLLSIQQEKKRDKGQIAFPLMGGEMEVLSSRDVQMCGTNPGSHRRENLRTWTLSEGYIIIKSQLLSHCSTNIANEWCWIEVFMVLCDMLGIICIIIKWRTEPQ